MTTTLPSPHPDRASRIREVGFDVTAEERHPVERCNLCGADDWVVITQRDRYAYPITATACARCSLTVLNPRLTEAAYGRFYGEVYRPLVSAYHGRRIDARTIQGEQRTYAAEMGDFVAPFLTGCKATAFLDVGGSTGVVAAAFASRFGFDATIIDPSPAEIAEAKQLGVRTITGFVERWTPDQSYPVIGMFQTIDHLLDVAGTLRKLRQIIAADGCFIVDIVDFRAAYLRNWSVEEAVKIDHPYSLTELTIEALFRRTGFQIARRSYSADHLHIAYVCRPAEPDLSALPSPAAVAEFFREIRFVQNAPAPGRQG